MVVALGLGNHCAYAPPVRISALSPILHSNGFIRQIHAIELEALNCVCVVLWMHNALQPAGISNLSGYKSVIPMKCRRAIKSKLVMNMWWAVALAPRVCVCSGHFSTLYFLSVVSCHAQLRRILFDFVPEPKPCIWGRQLLFARELSALVPSSSSDDPKCANVFAKSFRIRKSHSTYANETTKQYADGYFF